MSPFVLVASVVGTASNLHSNAEPAKDKQTQCVKHEGLNKDELKHYRKFKGICRLKVNGIGLCLHQERSIYPCAIFVEDGKAARFANFDELIPEE